MTERRIYQFAIRSRKPAEQQDFATPDDFDLQFQGLVDASSDRIDNPLAYCFDFESERLLYTTHPSSKVQEILESAFLYRAQLVQAESLISVPIEQLGAFGSPPRELRPMFIFSLGRTGSTLLARYLTALNSVAVSEPDVLTQVCMMSDVQQQKLGAQLEGKLVAACLGSLAEFFGKARYIKLRSQCNKRPRSLVNGDTGGAAVMMLRKRKPWAISRHRAFGEGPKRVAEILNEGVAAIVTLSEAGHGPRIVWYEDLVSDPQRVLAELLPGADLETPAQREKIARIASEDSQGETRLARSAIQTRPVADDFAQRFEDAWRQQAATWEKRSVAREVITLLE